MTSRTVLVWLHAVVWAEAAIGIERGQFKSQGANRSCGVFSPKGGGTTWTNLPMLFALLLDRLFVIDYSRMIVDRL